jgi:predicted transporter
MMKLLDRTALPATLALAAVTLGPAAQAFPVTNVVPESSSISLLVPGLIVICGFCLYKAVRARARRESKSR